MALHRFAAGVNIPQLPPVESVPIVVMVMVVVVPVSMIMIVPHDTACKNRGGGQNEQAEEHNENASSKTHNKRKTASRMPG